VKLAASGTVAGAFPEAPVLFVVMRAPELAAAFAAGALWGASAGCCARPRSPPLRLA
jgi:hypothetical protein